MVQHGAVSERAPKAMHIFVVVPVGCRVGVHGAVIERVRVYGAVIVRYTSKCVMQASVTSQLCLYDVTVCGAVIVLASLRSGTSQV